MSVVQVYKKQFVFIEGFMVVMCLDDTLVLPNSFCTGETLVQSRTYVYTDVCTSNKFSVFTVL